MIQVDDRIGSAEIAPILRGLGCEVELTRLDFADVAFTGWGANGMPVSVGIEMKKLDDVLACIQSGRFAGHQLPGLIQCYDHIWLLVCGSWYGRRQDGVLLHKRANHRGQEYWTEAGGGQRRWLARDLESWFMTVMIMGNIRLHRVKDWHEGAEWIKLVSNWFAREDHKSHQVVYSGKHIWQDQALLAKPTLARRVAAELPHIGVKRSAEVARVFHTVAEMVEAEPKDWMQVEGVGRKIAMDIYRVIHQNGNGGGK